MKPDHIITCVYCGQTYPENTPTHGADVAVLTQHISQCEKHPMRAVIRERDDCLALLGARKMELDGYVAKLAQNVKEICELKAQLAQLRQEYDRYTEQQTDLTQREHQRHVEIKERLEQQLAQAQADLKRWPLRDFVAPEGWLSPDEAQQLRDTIRTLHGTIADLRNQLRS